MAQELGLSVSQIKYRLSKYEIKLGRNKLPLDAPKYTERECKRHGLGIFVLAHYTPSQRGYVCQTCSTQRSITRRRGNKEILVAENGGSCSRCGYNKCIGALHFHHADYLTKSIGIGKVMSRSLERAREEVAKCVLLCANCHAEVEESLRNAAVNQRCRNTPS